MNKWAVFHLVDILFSKIVEEDPLEPLLKKANFIPVRDNFSCGKVNFKGLISGS